jgi:hypothetical protein
MPTFVEKDGDFTVETTVKDGLVVEKRTQDVQPILDSNGRIANSGDGYSKSRDLQHVASIPLIVVEQWLKEGVDVFNPEHEAAVMRRLNDGGWLKLRTGGGRL